MLRPPTRSTLFPYTTLFRSQQVRTTLEEMRRSFPNSSWTARAITSAGQLADDAKNSAEATYLYQTAINAFPGSADVAQDRKSTRLNSSHRCISYAVFCLKKK